MNNKFISMILFLATAYYLSGSVSGEIVKECITFQLFIVITMFLKVGTLRTWKETCLSSIIYFLIGGIVFVLSHLLGHNRTTFYVR